MKELEKYSNCLKRIDEFSQNLGMKKEDRAIFEMKQSENENEKCLILKNGSFDSPEPWFIMDENDQIDFSDVWIVAMDEIKRKAQEGVMEISIDLEKLLADIKKEHPNLFVDMQAMVERVKNNERL